MVSVSQLIHEVSKQQRKLHHSLGPLSCAFPSTQVGALKLSIFEKYTDLGEISVPVRNLKH